MSTNTVVIQGLVKPDGTLQLEETVPLPAGRVSVTVEPIPYSPETDPLLLMLRGIWERREQRAVKPFRTGEEAQEALRRLRDDAAEEVADVGRLQEECRQLREAERLEREQKG